MTDKYKNGVYIRTGLVVAIILSLLYVSACDKTDESLKASISNSEAIVYRNLNDKNAHLWDRVRKNFAMIKRLKTKDNPRIQQFVKQYRANNQHMMKLSSQASPYMYYILEQLETRGMPTELALLPMIESAFQPQATSNKGAAGLWQFIPSTGRHFGLRQDSWYDGRRDVTASTKAALDYLQGLHRMFNRDWLLAIAAYNAGEGTVQKAIKKNKKAGKPTDYWSLPLPKETKEYGPKLLALAEVVAYPEKHEVSLPPIENKPYFGKVNPGKVLDFNKVAKLANVDVGIIKRLNPGYRKASTHPKGPQQILLPLENIEEFADNLAKKR